MNILHITSTDLRGAGSAAVAYNALLNANGHHSRLVVVFKTKNDPTILSFISPVNKSLRLFLDKAILCFHKIQTFAKVGKTHPDYYFYNLDERKSNFSAEAILKKIDYNPDVIFIHWVSNFINTATINKLHQLTQAKMFWVMVDNAPITGGCHYPWTCKGYETDCSNCPALLTPSKKRIAQRNLALKKANIPPDIQLLTQSSTDKSRAEKCNLYSHKAELIFLPIDETIFCPQSSTEARQWLKLPQDKKLIFFAATHVNERRKGYIELQDALTTFEQTVLSRGDYLQDYMLVIAGKQPPTYKNGAFHHIPSVYLGYLSEHDMVKAFNAATLFVCPALEDSGPSVLGQAILCATPTVAFATGVAVDVIQTNRSGYLARLGDSADLAKGIDFITHLNADEYAAMQAECRMVGIETYSFKAVGDRLEKLILTD
ncbi:MAG: glycosyltransferase [Tannerella sp.]|jgi:glycosyltransferase involved in cell wall biosynthesis|nr:glycosyltransferase [Tannerella sp.]